MRNFTGKIVWASMLVSSAAFIAGCAGDSASSFSILSKDQSFKSSSTFTQRKVDILWVVDNSGSMASSQNNLANNFPSFINNFVTKGYDFHMAITTTDSYLYYHYNDPNRAKYKGQIFDKNTPNLTTVFPATVKVGTSGSGDERPFMSAKAFLEDPLNSGFLRPGSFLAVIMISDEEDFSHNDYQNGISSYYFSENYNDPTMYTTKYMTDFLDLKTNSTLTLKNYNVNAITITSTACFNILNTGAQKIESRTKALAVATGGTSQELCDPFTQVLANISDKIQQSSAEFVLDSEPVPSTIQVLVNGVAVPQDATNGWTYNATNISVILHGTSIPAAGADIKINYDPKGVTI